MRVTPSTDGCRLELDTAEVRLLRWALERASFIDTPAFEQVAILSFCTRALEALPTLSS
jgi:hypothetical protein